MGTIILNNPKYLLLVVECERGTEKEPMVYLDEPGAVIGLLVHDPKNNAKLNELIGDNDGNYRNTIELWAKHKITITIENDDDGNTMADMVEIGDGR